MATRIFLIGVALLFFGIQLRTFETFVLNEQISGIINKRVTQKQANSSSDPLQAEFMMFGDVAPPPPKPPKYHSISPPRWLGYSLLSMGAVLVCSCPLCRR